MQKKECIAMILAGGQGSRLGILTRKMAKPAVPFGAKYRIIDFTLSNCSNSGLDTIGVLTQYRHLVLHSHIGNGSPWDLDRKHGGITMLPPYVKQRGGEWYKGTANAIYQNKNFVDQYAPEYVIILSGDHIYKMDYSLMLKAHKQKNADVTISVIEVPWEETSRFGIMRTDEQNRIKEFQEKPKKTSSNLASMGVYIFNWKVLKNYLTKDNQDSLSSNDFGKNIIPKMLNDRLNMLAYRFNGYWKDVGTIQSYWEANMDLLSDQPQLDLFDPQWPIYSVNPAQPPNYIASSAKVNHSLINEGCLIFGQMERSVLFPGVYVGKNTIIRNSVIMPNVKIGSNVIIENAIVSEKTIISDGCHIGYDESEKASSFSNDKQPQLAIIGESLILRKNTKIRKNSIISIENFENAPLTVSNVS
ncbi:MAG: glucose-1-phosphate adenylyltransferase [Firmicutes bacterium]|nr:glucose-1-phosphate adenylyltransferase [Bacillota bacterium]